MTDRTPAAAESDEDDLDGLVLIRAKWTLDEAATLAQAAQKARELAAYLESLAADGYELTAPIADDYGWCEKKG